MITITTLLILAWIHFLSDFVLQSSWMAENKSKCIKALGSHCLVYMIPFLVVFGWQFALLNGVIHFGVDFITSKINARFWENQRLHGFFVCVGCDQAIHLSTLVLTYNLIF